MAIAKQLVPGIHQRGQTLVWQGKTSRVISVEEAQVIAEKVCHIPSVFDELEAIDAEIMALAA